MTESLNIARALPFVSQPSIKTDTYLNPSDYVFWRFTGDATGEGRLYFGSRGTLERIVLTPLGLDLGTVVDTLNVPEKVWAVYRREPSGLFYHLTLFYPQRGIVVESGGKARGGPGSAGEDVPRDLSVYQIDLFAPTSIQNYLTLITRQDQAYVEDVIAHLELWPGFGEGVIQIEPR